MLSDSKGRIVNPMPLPSISLADDLTELNLSLATARVEAEMKVGPCTVIEIRQCDGLVEARINSQQGDKIVLRAGIKLWSLQGIVIQKLYLTHAAVTGGFLKARVSVGLHVDEPDDPYPLTAVSEPAAVTLAYGTGVLADIVQVLGRRTTGTRVGVLLVAAAANVNAASWSHVKTLAACITPLEAAGSIFIPVSNVMELYARQATNAANLTVYAKEYGHGF